jgi:hypothetical protein
MKASRAACWAALLVACLALAPAASGVLTFTRPDGTRAAFPGPVRVWCGPWEPGVPVRTLHVRVGRLGKAFWQLDAVLADVRRTPTVRLPNTFVSSEPEGARLFAYDPPNELSTDVEEARGTLVFRRAACGATPRVTVRVRATLGSEFFDGDPIDVRGLFSAHG